MKRIVVFASGSGSNFKAILDAVYDGTLKAAVVGLVASKPQIGAIDKASAKGIPVEILQEKNFSSYAEYTSALLGVVEKWNPDLIVLAGFLRKIPSELIARFEGRIINIHPSLLPKFGGKGFYGLNVHRAVLEAGEIISGCTVHLVTQEYDEGQILGQKTVPVLPEDTPETLQKRVLEQEHLLLPTVISNLI